MVTDFAETDHAQQNREAKAKTMARHCWEHGVTTPDLAMLIGLEESVPAAAALLRRLAREAGAKVPKAGSPTWPLAFVRLDQLEQWAAAHPDDPRAVVPHAAHYAEAFAFGETPQSGSDNRKTPDVVTGQSPGVTSAEIIFAPLSPPGWAELAALGPIRDTNCGIQLSARRGDVCGGPAIAWVPMRGAPDVPRCAGHPPVGDAWGARCDWTPKHPCRAPGMACWCPRCPPRHLTPPGSTVVDQAAITSGKRRSTTTDFQAARGALT